MQLRGSLVPNDLQDEKPHLLLHPLEEMQLLSLPAGRAAMWQDETVVWTSSETPVIVTHNQVLPKQITELICNWPQFQLSQTNYKAIVTAWHWRNFISFSLSGG